MSALKMMGVLLVVHCSVINMSYGADTAQNALQCLRAQSMVKAVHESPFIQGVIQEPFVWALGAVGIRRLLSRPGKMKIECGSDVPEEMKKKLVQSLEKKLRSSGTKLRFPGTVKFVMDDDWGTYECRRQAFSDTNLSDTILVKVGGHFDPTDCDWKELEDEVEESLSPFLKNDRRAARFKETCIVLTGAAASAWKHSDALLELVRAAGSGISSLVTR